VKPFSALLDRLSLMSSRLGKLRLLADYFATTPDPARGYALAALTSSLVLPHAKPAMLRGLVESRVDATLFGWSWDYVGDMAETAALIWPVRPGANRPPALEEVVEGLLAAGKSEVPRLVEGWLDALDATGRWALLKLITGELRVGVSARLAKTALAQWAGAELAQVEEVWHGLVPPYRPLFEWLEGRADLPSVLDRGRFRPLMLANPLEDEQVTALDPAAYLAEWKWDGIRVQAVGSREPGERRLFSRTADDVSRAFPDVVDALGFDAVLDGELLVYKSDLLAEPSAEAFAMPFEGHPVASFNDLQQRLNRKQVQPSLLERFPGFLRLYDALFIAGEDLRALPLAERRARLESWFAEVRPRRMDLSPLIAFASWEQLARLRDGAREGGIEGLMLKRRDSSYVGGRPKGPWFKWKRSALTLDAVLMYAQRGSGKRSSFYSDYTFGAWRMGADGRRELVPVGKAYFGFTDAELRQLDKWVRDNTVQRFGPVREVRPGLVLEVAFDSVHRSSRHRSGLAMRFPRVSRIRWDKPADEGDRLETLEKMVSG
jgi:DNA ligase-1